MKKLLSHPALGLLVFAATAHGAGKAVTLSPSSLTFTARLVGTASAVQALTLTNGTAAAVTVNTVGSTLADFSQTNTCGTLPASLAAGASCTISVVFKPAAVGTRTGTIAVVYGTTTTLSATLTGTGLPPVSLSQTSIAFGNQAVGSTSAATTVTLTNNQAVALTSFLIATPVGFLQTNTCATVAPGATCTISVSFKPTQTGPAAGTLTITDSAGQQTVSLSGTGVLNLTVSPTNLNFGKGYIGVPSQPQTVTVTTGISTPVAISIAIAGDYSQTNACPAQIVASCTIALVFTPTTSGNRRGTLTITAAGAANSPQTVSFSGIGQTPLLTSAPVSLSFVKQLVATSSPVQTLTLTGVSQTKVVVAASGDFSQTNNCPSTLATGATCAVKVTFTPTLAGTRIGQITVTDGTGNNLLLAPLTGLGFTLPDVSALSSTNLPFGPYALTVNGLGFNSGAVVTLGSTVLATTFVSPTQLTCTGVTLVSQQGTAVNLVVTNGPPGSQASAPVPVTIGVQNPLVSASAAQRFLEQAAFGPRPSDVMQVQKLGFQGWLTQQFAIPAATLYADPTYGYVYNFAPRFLKNSVMGTDQLRQRIAFALSQLFVVSMNKLMDSRKVGPYLEMLYQNSFGTFPNLLSSVTLHPTMGVFLDMVNNDKADPILGTVANENYAREVMQLFSIGTVMLNVDGTQVTPATPTYNQTTIQNVAKVFTGWTFGPLPGATSLPHNPEYYLAPMAAVDSNHDMTAKTLLNNLTLPAGQTAVADMTATMNNIVSHQNVAPFVSKSLIQHLVTSNPSPAYVARVAGKFNNNGSGVKGDMQAVITAILLDTEARAGDATGATTPTFGHLQEPALWTAALLRALNGTAVDTDMTNNWQYDLANMNQDLFNPPSVFNYYSPQYRVNGIPGPEFQIQSPYAAVYRANFVDIFFPFYATSTQTGCCGGASADLSPWVNLAGDRVALVDALDSTFTHGQMPATMKQTILTAVQGVTPGQGNIAAVAVGAYLIVTSSFYQVMH